MNIKRGNIYLANLDPTVGNEISKTRPVLVISNDLNNEFNNLITVIPITSNTKKVLRFEVFLAAGTANLPKDSKVKVDHVRAIDMRRIVKEIGSLSFELVGKVEEALRIHLLL